MEKPEKWEEQERVRSRSDRLRWMINLRWIALAGLAASDIATQVVGYTGNADQWFPWLVIPLAVLYNLLFFLWIRRTRQSKAPLEQIERSLKWQCYLQALCDILALDLLVYSNGGVEYPLFYAPVLAVVLSGMLLPRRAAFLQANLGAAVFAVTSLAEYYGWIPHFYFLAPAYRHELYRDFRAVVAIILSLTGVLNVAAFLVSNMAGQLNQAEERIRRLLGQLRRQVKQAAGQLAQASAGLQGGAEEVNRVAGQIATTVQQIAQGAATQATQIERLSQSLEHLAEAGRRVAEGSQETRLASAESVSTADRGRQASSQATSRMQEIARVFNQAQAALLSLAQRSSQIAEVAAAIDRFAERTDLLALNASIEAARAGEHGRGFAVVASEVKKLAASSSASTERVTEMVAQVQADIAEVVQAVQAGMERVQRGQESIATLQEVLDGMAMVITHTDELTGTMEHLSRQQLESHREIIRAAGEIASTAEQTAAGAEETAAAIEEQVSSFAEFGEAVQDLAGLAAQLDQAVAGLSEGR
jgi:methyl-accepting chemotaxis protein